MMATSQRSAAAANEIEKIATETVGSSERGSTMVSDVTSQMTELEPATLRPSSSVMQEVVAASGEQAHGLANINSAAALLTVQSSRTHRLWSKAPHGLRTWPGKHSFSMKPSDCSPCQEDGLTETLAYDFVLILTPPIVCREQATPTRPIWSSATN
jgi:hypothetical protein